MKDLVTLLQGWCWQNKEIEMKVSVCVLCDIASGVH
jgi:hypothetical protein